MKMQKVLRLTPSEWLNIYIPVIWISNEIPLHCSFSNFLKTHGTREKVINEKKVNVRVVMKSNEDKTMSQNQTSITGYLTADSNKKQHNVTRSQGFVVSKYTFC